MPGTLISGPTRMSPSIGMALLLAGDRLDFVCRCTTISVIAVGSCFYLISQNGYTLERLSKKWCRQGGDNRFTGKIQKGIVRVQ
jgi:hypothetical protein